MKAYKMVLYRGGIYGNMCSVHYNDGSRRSFVIPKQFADIKDYASRINSSHWQRKLSGRDSILFWRIK